MRHICIAALVAGALSNPALAQSLRPSYGPDGASQSAHTTTVKRLARASKATTQPVAPREALQREAPAATQSSAAPAVDP